MSKQHQQQRHRHTHSLYFCFVVVLFSRHPLFVQRQTKVRISTTPTNTSAAQKFRDILKTQLVDIQAAGTYKRERVISSAQETLINVQGRQEKLLNFCANNYLGLSVKMIRNTKNFNKCCFFF